MYLHNRSRYSFYCIVEGNGCMRISACIHNDPVVIEADFMDLVYHLTFHVTLKISNLTLWILGTQLTQIAFKRSISVHCRFTLA